MVLKLFELWQLPKKGQLVVLGLSSGSRRTLERYRKGGPLANNLGPHGQGG